MKTISLVLLAALPAYAFGQTSAKPLTQTEVLGRLAAGYSPSYVAQLVKVRGIRFSTSENFLSSVRSAGGEGILVERLSSAETSGPTQSFSDSDQSIVQLARCAEFVWTGDTDSAGRECRAATEQNPQSLWPWLATLHVYDMAGVSSEERTTLLDRCAASLADLAKSHEALKLEEPSPEERREETTKLLMEVADSGDDGAYLYTSQSDAEYRDQPELESFSPELEGQIRSEIEKLLQAAPDLAHSHISAAHFYQSLGDASRELAEWKEALRLESGNAGIHYALGQFYRSQHQVEPELAEFREAVRMVPYGTPEHQGLAESLLREGRLEAAIGEWRAFVALSPQNLRASNALVQLYLKSKDRPAAISELRRSLKASFETTRDETAYANARFQDIDYLAQLLSEEHEFAAAAELYKFQLRHNPASASLHNSYANTLFAIMQFAEAASEYRAALQSQPELSLVHRNLGVCLAAEKDFDGAIAEYRLAQESDPDDRSIRILLGDALMEKGELNGAMDQFREALRRNPEDASARTHLARAFFANHDSASAVGELMRALELKPDFPEAENELASIYANSTDPLYRNPAAALSAARKAAKSSDGPIPAYLDTLAEALLLNGQALEALQTEEQAAKLAGDEQAFHSRLERFRQAALSASTVHP